MHEAASLGSGMVDGLLGFRGLIVVYDVWGEEPRLKQISIIVVVGGGTRGEDTARERLNGSKSASADADDGRQLTFTCSYKHTCATVYDYECVCATRVK